MQINETYKELDKLSIKELYKLSEVMGIGINLNNDEKDIQGEMAFILSLESKDKINKGLARLKNAD